MKPKLGDIAHITFLDHVCWSSEAPDTEPLQCEVFGRVVYVSKLVVIVASWLVSEKLDDNSESFAIVRSTITKYRRLK